MNPQFHSHLIAHMTGVLAKFRSSGLITHAGEKGRAREALVAAAIEPWFGPSVSIGSGFIIDSFGNSSRQADNVIFWPDVQPQALLGGHSSGPGVFPIEGVAATVEVKSKLTTAELSSAIDNLNSVRKLQALSSAPMDSNGDRQAHFFINTLLSIVAFESDVAFDTLKKTLVGSEVWDSVCVLGEKGGLFVRGRNSKRLQLLPPSASDEQKLAVFSIITRDNIQNSRLYRLTAGLESYVDYDNNTAQEF